ncbi:MAG: hypothetical protein IJR99_12960 [Kiritimatiellae bacterium]|nr:hypothetical protein [Kiritimatiellia bacterium]
MTKLLLFCFILLRLSVQAMPFASGRPFILPVGAIITDSSETGKGWKERGVFGVTFVNAQKQFQSACLKNGWQFVHTVPLALSGGHSLYTWRRGSQELTLMLWRIDVGRTGFSWGVSKSGK